MEFAYDYQGRRARKTVYTYNAGWSLSSDTAFVYDGWKLLLELDVRDPNAMTITRRYSWGLDLAGLNGGGATPSPFQGEGGGAGFLERAGTIGGLLAMNDPADDPNDVARDYVYFHDASGNVTQLVDLAADPNAVVADPTAAIVVHYEYGPYGRRVNADPNNPDAYDQPFGFSGKYGDAETGLGYWGRRYYHPALGRWISRDPISEAGGTNLYAYVGNDPASRSDAIGATPLPRNDMFVHPCPAGSDCAPGEARTESADGPAIAAFELMRVNPPIPADGSPGENPVKPPDRKPKPGDDPGPDQPCPLGKRDCGTARCLCSLFQQCCPNDGGPYCCNGVCCAGGCCGAFQGCCSGANGSACCDFGQLCCICWDGDVFCQHWLFGSCKAVCAGHGGVRRIGM